MVIMIKNYASFLPSLPPTLELPQKACVEDLLIGLDIRGQYGYLTVLQNGKQAALETLLEDQDTITLAPLLGGG